MQEIAFFISEEYLKDNSPLSALTEADELYPFMKGAQDTYIQEAVGTKLFNRLVASLTASPKNTTADEKLLLFKIRDALVWYVCYDALPFLHIKTRNIGVVKQSGDNMENADRADVSYLAKKCKDKGDFYMRLMQEWLCVNSIKFPEYRCGSWNCAELTPNRPVGPSCDLAFDKNDNTHIDTAFARKWLNDR